MALDSIEDKGNSAESTGNSAKNTRSDEKTQFKSRSRNVHSLSCDKNFEGQTPEIGGVLALRGEGIISKRFILTSLENCWLIM